CFTITCNGTPGGVVGQLSDGQLRCGQGFAASTFCISEKGGLIDANGFGCILTPPTKQFQCDHGVEGFMGWSISDKGLLFFEQISTWVTCPTGDHGGYNIYRERPGTQGGCVEITITADSCFSSVGSTSDCPATLVEPWEFPHLIVPIDSSKPTTTSGTQFFGNISSTVSSTFRFDISGDLKGKTCSLVFMFPERYQLETSNFEISGSGEVTFSLLEHAITESMSYNSSPNIKKKLVTHTLVAGHSYTIDTFDCPAGESIGFKMETCDTKNPTKFNWFQDYNPCP
ncbi:uncharacterized protein K452DRAFT_229286, partial [Aplosporella prunicola CBS 121167]